MNITSNNRPELSAIVYFDARLAGALFLFAFHDFFGMMSTIMVV